MVQNATPKIKFFYLAHGVMSLHCLKGLIKNGRIPEFTVIHENRDREKLDSKFFFPLIEYCDLNGIRIFKVKKLNELKSEISECNLGVCCGFMEIIKKDVYSLPEFGILNLHCGKLPEYRGRAPISRTIMNGDESLIISVHRIDDGVDSGDLLIEKKLRIELTDDVNTLYEKCALISGEIFCEAICELETGECNYHPQSGSSFIAGKLLSEDERLIKWSAGVKKSYDKMRALYTPYPQSFFDFKGKRYFINRAGLVKVNTKKSDFAEVTEVNDNFIRLALADGEILIFELNDINRKEISLLNEFKTGEKFYDN